MRHSSVCVPTPEARCLAVIGCGYNTRCRVGPALAGLNGQLTITGYDLIQPRPGQLGFTCVPVKDDEDLFKKLVRQKPTDVLIETPDDCHLRHIKLALRAGAPRVYCEKCLADSTEEAAELLPQVAGATGQEVFVIDHYTLLEQVLCLVANARRWLGEVKFIRARLFEAQGVPPYQVRSQASLAQFYHHLLALAVQFFDPADLEPVAAKWARHPTTDPRVRETYRAAQFASKRTGKVVFDGAVGKYLPPGSRRILVEGTHGVACLDRDRGELRVSRPGQTDHTVVSAPGDGGYRELAWALAGGPLPPTLLSIGTAFEIRRLIDQAHAQAREVRLYENSRGEDFVCDWQSRGEAASRATAAQRPYYLSHDIVNAGLAQRRGDIRGVAVAILDLRDSIPEEPPATLLIDWDSLEADARETVLGRLLARPTRGRIGLHSYNLDVKDARTLSRKGVAVFERLEPNAINWLLDGRT